MEKIHNLVLLIFISMCLMTGSWECGKAPPTQQPQRRKAGEGFPPLPLPVTPLRRSEKKNPPSPPVIIGKVICGPDDKWTRAENDIENLLKIIGQTTGINYRAIKISLNNFSFDPEEIPILYITSVEPLLIEEKNLTKIKEFLLKGGFIWANASSGSPEFTKDFVKTIEKIFPDRNFYPLFSNHPLTNCFYNIKKVKILEEGKEKETDINLRTLNIGCRGAIILSPYDLGCGWAMHTHPWGTRYIPEDAIKIGTNMFLYSLNWIEYGKYYSQFPLYLEKEKSKTGKIYLGQVKHSGDWNPSPGSIGKFLKNFSENTETFVYSEPIAIDLKKDDLKDVPILYITGHYDPNFDEIELKKLRDFLLKGGSIIGNSCCGSDDFTSAFQKIINKIIPESKKVIPKENDKIFQFPFLLTTIFSNYKLKDPIEIYYFKERPVIIFSKYDIGSGWENISKPFIFSLNFKDSKEIGTNILVYLLTH